MLLQQGVGAQNFLTYLLTYSYGLPSSRYITTQGGIERYTPYPMTCGVLCIQSRASPHPRGGGKPPRFPAGISPDRLHGTPRHPIGVCHGGRR